MTPKEVNNVVSQAIQIHNAMEKAVSNLNISSELFRNLEIMATILAASYKQLIDIPVRQGR